ncbi:MAG: hypothetical protein CMI16_06545 [Opitutaceae bacterium]|nr:hypothetical protein [Opitutaceae bacterium]
MSKKRTRDDVVGDDDRVATARDRLAAIIDENAIYDGHDELVRLVMTIKKSGTIDSCRASSFGCSLLHDAVRCSKRDLVELLLRCGANPNVAVEAIDYTDLDDRENDVGTVPLHFARDASMAELLLGVDDGDAERFWEADVDAADSWGETPFDRCVEYENPEMARFFLERSKNILAGDDHPKRWMTTGCALAAKIADLETRSTDEASRVASAFRDLLPVFADRSNPDALFGDMERYSFYPREIQKVGAYAVLVDLLVRARRNVDS